MPKAGKKIIRVTQLADYPMSASCLDRDPTDKDQLPLNQAKVLLSEEFNLSNSTNAHVNRVLSDGQGAACSSYISYNYT